MLILGFFASDRATGGETGINDIHIYAMRYGQSQFKLKDIYLADKTLETTEFAWLFYLVTMKDRIILIDTGFFDKKKINYYNIKNYIHPTELLLVMGIEPDDITDVIITHKHFDHIGLVYLYTNANIYIQNDDYQSLLQQHSNRYFARITDFLESCNLLQVIKGNYSITPSFEIKKSGGHTRGSQIVILKTKKKPIIFTGDECYFIEGCVNTKTNSLTENRYKNQQILHWLKTAFSDNSAVLLTFHDPLICRLYPQIYENIFQVW